ncbi:MAG: GerMN domain-containing protein, partial [Acidobacteriota bacterium]
MLVATCLLLLSMAGCKGKSEKGTAAAGNQVAARVARLYFESPAMLLVAEPRNLQLPQNAAGAIPIVVRELLKGPVNPALTRAYPEDTFVRGAFLLPDGTVFVDLGGATLTRGWATGSHEELMAVYSMIQTLAANFVEVKRVRILVNGVVAETLAG